jgi:hypothetical protein
MIGNIIYQDIHCFTKNCILELSQNRIILEEKRVKYFNDKGLGKLEFCLNIIENISVPIILAPIPLGFVVSPWILLAAPIAFTAGGIAHLVKYYFFGVSSYRDHLKNFHAAVEGENLPVGKSLLTKVEITEAEFNERTCFLRHIEQVKNEDENTIQAIQESINTLKTIALLFSSLNSIEKGDLNQSEAFMTDVKKYVRISSLAGEKKHVFGELCDKVVKNANALKLKIDAANKPSKEEILQFISDL